MISRLIRIGDAISQLFNVLIFNGDTNYSISGDAYRFERHHLVVFIDWLFFVFEKNHCNKAYLHDVEKAKSLVDEHLLRKNN